MNLLEVTLALTLSFGSVVARAQPAIERATPDDAGTPATLPMPAADEEVASAAGETRAVPNGPAPRGELVRLSRLPEAELMIDVHLVSNDENASFEITSEKYGASLLVCGKPCKFRIWPGQYRLYTHASSHFVGGTNRFVVERNATLRLTEPSAHRPVVGALLGVLGVASAIVGGALLATNACGAGCSPSTTKRSQLGFALLGSGAVLAPVGWLLFAQSRNPDLVVEQNHSNQRE